MNNLLYAGAYVAAETFGKMKKNKRNENWKEPRWKRRIQANIAEWRKDVSRLNERRKGTFAFGKKDIDIMERKYKLSDVGNVQIIDMLKEKIAGATKIRRYEKRVLHYHQNTLFATNQKLDGHSNNANETPDAQEVSEFQNNIWLILGNLPENVSWLSKAKGSVKSKSRKILR